MSCILPRMWWQQNICLFAWSRNENYFVTETETIERKTKSYFVYCVHTHTVKRRRWRCHLVFTAHTLVRIRKKYGRLTRFHPRSFPTITVFSLCPRHKAICIIHFHSVLSLEYNNKFNFALNFAVLSHSPSVRLARMGSTLYISSTLISFMFSITFKTP